MMCHEVLGQPRLFGKFGFYTIAIARNINQAPDS